MTLMLQVVKDRDLRAGAEQRRGEAGVEEHIDLAAQHGHRQHRLLPQQARRAVDSAYHLRHVYEVGLRGYQIGSGLAVGEDVPGVAVVDFSQSG